MFGVLFSVKNEQGKEGHFAYNQLIYRLGYNFNILLPNIIKKSKLKIQISKTFGINRNQQSVDRFIFVLDHQFAA